VPGVQREGGADHFYRLVAVAGGGDLAEVEDRVTHQLVDHTTNQGGDDLPVPLGQVRQPAAQTG
jgi:hypothetical protein